MGSDSPTKIKMEATVFFLASLLKMCKRGNLDKKTSFSYFFEKMDRKRHIALFGNSILYFA